MSKVAKVVLGILSTVFIVVVANDIIKSHKKKEKALPQGYTGW